jgi:hypothetical protein
MLDEALRVVDEARADGVKVRIVGGLAVLAQCADPAYCRREYRDVDVVALRRQVKPLLRLLTRLGYEENRHVRLASGGASLQVYRACEHAAAGRARHTDDRVDVYLDSFRLHHEIPLRRRLALEPYTVPLADVLLIKLQRERMGWVDVHDVIGLLRDARLAEDEEPGALGLRYFGRVTARDWGLYHDVMNNLDVVQRRVPGSGLGDAAEARVRLAIGQLREALVRARKGPWWRMRAMVGERLPWHDTVDEREGVRIGVRERPAVSQDPVSQR